jgi:hypothetical protein
MKTPIVTVLAVILLSATPVLADSVSLNDWTFNINGSTYNPPPLSSEFDASGFDFTTGLGSITLRLPQGIYSSIIGYFDHDIIGDNNGVANEVGSVNGSPGAGQSWEIDQPGYLYNDPPLYTGDLVANVLAGNLDNLYFDGNYTGPDDVAMALGWAFTVDPGKIARITWDVTTTEAPSGFYLQQNDVVGVQSPTSTPPIDIYFSSSLTIQDEQNIIPEPSAWILLATALGLVSYGKLKRSVS